MSQRRHIRSLAIQALYQMDVRDDDEMDQIDQSILDAPHNEQTKQEALTLARAAWAKHEQADELATELAPDWPTHRQPLVDRSIIRLAYYEMADGNTPAPVAINEAVELAKTFGSEHSSSFMNGVLDKIAKRLRQKPTIL